VKDPRIVQGSPTFKTPDGLEHATWNAARRHLTGLDLLDTLRKAGPGLSDRQLLALRDGLLESWNVSKRTKG